MANQTSAWRSSAAGGVRPTLTSRGAHSVVHLFVSVTFVGIVHRPVRDRLKGLAMAVSNTNGGMDLQPFRAEVTAVG